MSTVVRGDAGTEKTHPSAPLAKTRYGYFLADGTEYCVTNPHTPRPWVNVISNPRFGLAVSQTGSGFTWVDNSQLAVITRWQQEFARDASGKFLFVRDTESGETWTLAPAPLFPTYDRYECRHGIGYSTFITEFAGVQAEWTLFCHPTESIEMWRVELRNLSDKPRRLEIAAYLEWNCGVLPSPRREFHRLFLETEFDSKRGAIFARNHMWDVPSADFGHWNTDFPYISALAGTEPVLCAQGDKATFYGRAQRDALPAAIGEDVWQPVFGRHEDAIAALRSAIELSPGESRSIGYTLAVGQTRGEVDDALRTSLNIERIDEALADVRAGWRDLLDSHRVETPDDTVNCLTNDWLRYQAISGRIWGRCGYYQQSGAFGFRDQLQDSQVWLTIDPQRCRQQLKLHAAHQFQDGSVYHWWHPLSEQGLTTRMTDDLLWLAFVTASYIKETGDLNVLNDQAPFIDSAEPAPLIEHVRRAFTRVFSRMSERGLPFIGAGDWNDGLSAAGLQERGESIWLGHFLAGVLADWAEILQRVQNANITLHWKEKDTVADLAAEYTRRREELVAAINEHGWDGEWYLRATLDDGSTLGSNANRVGRIFLNAQTWAVLNDVAPPERATQCMQSVRKLLVSKAGALLLAPAFDTPRSNVGYITRYAPGMRENGGVYTHAATWAIAAACKVRDNELAGQLLDSMNPAVKDPDQYWAEPYVTPGNVDGPDSPHHGRGGWTWYTGSASWLHRVITQWVLGVRPEWDGLRIEPCLPPAWTNASVTREYRGETYEIHITRSSDLPAGVDVEIAVDGTPFDGTVIAPEDVPGRRHVVDVRVR